MLNKKKIITLSIALLAIVLVLGAIAAIHGYSASRFDYTVNDTLPSGEGKTARVILLGGQSNASGCSIDEYLRKNVSEEKYAGIRENEYKKTED